MTDYFNPSLSQTMKIKTQNVEVNEKFRDLVIKDALMDLQQATSTFNQNSTNYSTTNRHLQSELSQTRKPKKKIFNISQINQFKLQNPDMEDDYKMERDFFENHYIQKQMELDQIRINFKVKPRYPQSVKNSKVQSNYKNIRENVDDSTKNQIQNEESPKITKRQTLLESMKIKTIRGSSTSSPQRSQEVISQNKERTNSQLGKLMSNESNQIENPNFLSPLSLNLKKMDKSLDQKPDIGQKSVQSSLFAVLNTQKKNYLKSPEKQQQFALSHTSPNSQDQEINPIVLDVSFNQSLRVDEQEAHRSYIRKFLKQKVDQMIQRTSEILKEKGFKNPNTKQAQHFQQKLEFENIVLSSGKIIKRHDKTSKLNDQIEQKLKVLRQDKDFNDLIANVFPSDLQERPDFKYFIAEKYQQILKSLDKNEIQIIDSMKNERNQRDYEKMERFFCQYDLLNNQEKQFYVELTNLCETMTLQDGQILRLLNVYFLMKGRIKILSKKDRSLLGYIGEGSLICQEKFLADTDLYYRDNSKQFYESDSDDVVMIKVSNGLFGKILEDYKKKQNYHNMKFLSELPFLKDQTAEFFESFLKNICIQNFNKGDYVYKEGEIPKYFQIVREGILKVEKEIEVKNTHYWPKEHNRWSVANISNKTRKIVQQIYPSDYFGEIQVLKSVPSPCDIVVVSDHATLFGFEKDHIVANFKGLELVKWLTNYVIVKFKGDKELLQQTLIDKKIQKMYKNAFLNSTMTNPIQDDLRISYMKDDVIKMQKRMKPWFQMIQSANKNCKSMSQPVSPKRLNLTATTKLPNTNQEVILKQSLRNSKNKIVAKTGLIQTKNHDILESDCSEDEKIKRDHQTVNKLTKNHVRFNNNLHKREKTADTPKQHVDRYTINLRGYQIAMNEKDDLFDKEMAENISKKVFQHDFVF
eukprot:403372810